MMNRSLTKSMFKRALECDAKLLYAGRKDFKDASKNDDFLAGLAAGGFQVGALAQGIYAAEAVDEGVPWFEIEGNEDEQVELTNEKMKLDQVTLFEPTIRVDGFSVRVDVLRKRGSIVELIEVKSKSFDGSNAEPFRGTRGGIMVDWKPYLYDVAFQALVFQKAFPGLTVKPCLLMPDKSMTGSTDGLHRMLPISQLNQEARFVKAVSMPSLDTIRSVDHAFMRLMDVSGEVAELSGVAPKSDSTGLARDLAEVVDIWRDIYLGERALQPMLKASACSKCEFYSPEADQRGGSGFHNCWRARFPEMPVSMPREQTVLGLFGDKRRVKQSVLDDERYRLDAVRPEDLGEVKVETPLSLEARQWMQVSGQLPSNEGSYFDFQTFQQERETWTYPYYFLDFEAALSPLPLAAGQHPNSQNAFQYSVHMLFEDGSLTHHADYIDLVPSLDSHLKLLRALLNDLGDCGTVFQWSPYENTVLNTIRARLLSEPQRSVENSELVSFLDSLTRRKDGGHLGVRAMVDLADVANGCYFHPATGGSSSIKKLLPAILGESSYLRELYSRPVYGGDGEILSHNYKKRRMIWWRPGPDGPYEVIDPYKLITEYAAEVSEGHLAISVCHDLEQLCDNDAAQSRPAASSLNNGGAAMMAYLLIQSGNLSDDAQEILKAEMLRYCELDTLAMAMVMQGFLHR